MCVSGWRIAGWTRGITSRVVRFTIRRASVALGIVICGGFFICRRWLACASIRICERSTNACWSAIKRNCKPSCRRLARFCVPSTGCFAHDAATMEHGCFPCCNRWGVQLNNKRKVLRTTPKRKNDCTSIENLKIPGWGTHLQSPHTEKHGAPGGLEALLELAQIVIARCLGGARGTLWGGGAAGFG